MDSWPGDGAPFRNDRKNMPFRNSVNIVASPRSRVGKTLLARLLTDFHLQEGRRVAAFDLNSGGGALARFVPEYTAVSEITDVKGQMALFDRLIADDGVTKIVDLGHESFKAFFALAQQIGFAEEARRRAIAPAILFVITPDATSVEAFRGLHNRFPDALLAPVHNEIFGAAQHRDKYELMGSRTLLARLPVLAPGVRKYIETPPFAFADERLAAAGMPPEAYDELQRWLRRVYREFRELDLRILLADLQSAIRLES
jgi:hypothetical protein